MKLLNNDSNDNARHLYECNWLLLEEIILKQGREKSVCIQIFTKIRFDASIKEAEKSFVKQNQSK